MIDLGRLRMELTAASADAGVDPGSIVVFVVRPARPEGTTPLAYLNPAGEVRSDTVAVFRAVGAQRAAQHAGVSHRFAVWRELPGFPAAALGPMLRHELEHARRFELSGPAFFAADDLLRAAVRDAGGHGYGALPSELEANAASAAYAARSLSEAQLAELRDVPECAALLERAAPPPDVAGATFVALDRLDPTRADELRREAAAWDPASWRRSASTTGPVVLEPGV